MKLAIRLRALPSLSPLIEALHEARVVDPVVIPSGDARAALQLMFELGAPPAIDREEPTFVWRWSESAHRHWLVVEEGDDAALAWVAPKDVWPHSAWLLQRLAGLRRVELHVACSWHGISQGRAARYRRQRVALADWLSDHRSELTALIVDAGAAQGSFDRLCIELSSNFSPLDHPPFDIGDNGHWDTEQDFPYVAAPYVRRLPRPWSYQTIEAWKP